MRRAWPQWRSPRRSGDSGLSCTFRLYRKAAKPTKVNSFIGMQGSHNHFQHRIQNGFNVGLRAVSSCCYCFDQISFRHLVQYRTRLQSTCRRPRYPRGQPPRGLRSLLFTPTRGFLETSRDALEPSHFFARWPYLQVCVPEKPIQVRDEFRGWG